MDNLLKIMNGEEFMLQSIHGIVVCNISATKEKEKKWTQGVMWYKLGSSFM